MTGALEGRVAWVSGAASGIGAATARRLAAEGALVGCLDIDGEGVSAVVAAIEGSGGTAVPVAVDVTDWSAVSRAASELEATLGSVEAVVAAAGIVHRQVEVVDLEIATWQHVLDVNVTGVFLTVKAAIPQLRRRGRGAVIVVSSVGGVRGSSGYCAYTTSKHAVIGLMRTLANELAPSGIRVNAICPGPVDTPMLDRQAAELGISRASAVGQWSRAQLLKRLVTSDEVADAVLWLAQDGSRMVTGVALPLDGGYLARAPEAEPP